MNFDDRVNAVADFGFTERQARFLVTVMLYAGVCVPRQYAAFARVAYGHKISKFFDKLEQRQFATVSNCVHNRARIFHVRHHALYRAIGQAQSRYRRPMAATAVIDRLMRVDAMVRFPELVWLATEEEKVAFFSLMAPSLPAERLPHITAESGSAQCVSLFPDEQPIAVTSTGRVVFMYVVTGYDQETLRAFVQRHADLFRALPGWTLRLIFPEPLASSIQAFEALLRDELAPSPPEVLAQLKWYFATRRNTTDPRALSFENPDFWEAQGAFSSNRFQLLYRRWLSDGSEVFDGMSSTAITQALEKGTGRIESHVLRLSYEHLAPLVSLFRSHRRGGRGWGNILRAVSTPVT